MDNEYVKGAENAYSLISQSNNDMINLWLTHTFLTWQWWLGVLLTIVPWVLWILFRKNESTNRLLFVGFFVMLITSWLDLMGILFGLWSYYHNVVPFSPAFIPWDFTLLPVTIMVYCRLSPKLAQLLKQLHFLCLVLLSQNHFLSG